MDRGNHLAPCAKDAYLLFQDLCLLTNSEHARFLRLNNISKTFGLELIESVLTNHFHLFKLVSQRIQFAKKTKRLVNFFINSEMTELCPANIAQGIRVSFARKGVSINHQKLFRQT
jgi:hypothetical protein